MAMGSVPYGLGPHTYHEIVGWPNPMLKLKILKLMIIKIFKYSKSFITYPNLVQYTLICRCYESLHSKRKTMTANKCAFRGNLEFYKFSFFKNGILVFFV